jgi:hypothetical protein
MPVIKPRTTQKQFVRHITRLYRENNELLFAYAKFIAEPTEYVLNQLVENVLGRDKDFHAWRAEHPESCVPKPGEHQKRRGRLPAANAVQATPVVPLAKSA